MVSDWIPLTAFDWDVQRESTTEPGVMRVIDKIRVEQDGGASLWLRAVAQPWMGSQLKVTLGLFTSKDIKKIQDYTHPRFPYIGYLSLHTPFLPIQLSNYKICLPFTPYILAQPSNSDEENELPPWITLITSCNRLFRNTTAPNQKGNASTLMESLKTDWRKEKILRYIFPEIRETQAPANTVEATGRTDQTPHT